MTESLVTGGLTAGAVVPLIAALVALAADSVLSLVPGARQGLDAPRAVFRGLARWFDVRLNRPARGRFTLRIRGALVVVIVLAIAVAAGYGLADLARQVRHGWLIDAVTLLCLLGFMRPVLSMRGAAAALRGNDADAGVRRLRWLVRFDVPAGDPHAVARAAVEGGSARLVEGLFGALFWFLLLGLPALVIYRGLGAAADAIGRNSPGHADFGFAARRLDDVLSLPGALIAGPVLALAALFCPGANAPRAFAGWAHDLGARGVATGFRGEGAVAGAFGLALGGPRLFDGETVTGPWIGGGRARAETADIQRAVFLFAVAGLLVALGLALVLVAASG